MKAAPKCKREASLDEILVEFNGPVALAVGHPVALADAWLILPEWVPALPKRVASSGAFDGWWPSHEEADWDAETRYRDRPEAFHRVDSWELRRMAGGVFGIRLWPQRSRRTLGGEIDPEAPRRALDWHRKMVRARRDESFRRFARVALALS